MSTEVFETLYNEFNIRIKKKEFESALALILDLLEQANNNDIDVFYTLMGKATALTNLDRDDEVLDTYSEIINRFHDSKNEVIFKFLAYSYYNKALIYGKQKDLENELNTYNELLEKYITEVSSELEIVLVKTYINKAICVGTLEDRNSSLLIYKELVSNFENSEDEAVLEQVLSSMCNIASIHEKNKNTEEAIVSYDYIISKFKDFENQNIKELVAKSLINKASRIKELNKIDEALELYDEVVETFGDYDGKILNQVALALHNKSVILSTLHREKELFAVCDLIIKRFSNSKDELIMNIVSSAEVVKEKEKFNFSF